MTDGRWWAALVTFELRDESEDILPGWAHGACGWMIAVAPDEEHARRLLVRDVEHHGLRVVEIVNESEVLADDELEGIDHHLALNFRNIEPGKQTVWGPSTATRAKVKPELSVRFPPKADISRVADSDGTKRYAAA